MKRLPLLLLILCTCFINLRAQNPLLQHSNAPIDFTTLTPGIIREAGTTLTTGCDKLMQKIVLAAKQQTLSNTLTAFDSLGYELGDLIGKLQLIAVTFKDDSIRNAASDAYDGLQLYVTNIYLNEPLYKALKKFNSTKAAQLTSAQKKFLSESLTAFEKNGMQLPAAQRKTLAAINEKVVTLSTAFERNIAESNDSLVFSDADLQGVPDAAKAPWKRDGDKYVVSVIGPNLTTVLQNAHRAETRKQLYLHYNNRAYPKNIAVLDSLLFYRNQFAKLLGFTSYAAYAVVDKMAATPAAVWAFEKDLVQKLTPQVTDEIKTLSQLKHSLFPAETDTVYAWDFPYLHKKLLNAKYQLNTDDVKEYFEMNNSLQGMFGVYEKLLNIQIKETTGVPVWDASVKTFDMWKDGKKCGSFYLDLYPRPNKYTHFACFPMSQYRATKTGENLPTATLVCNFPEPTTAQPSLLQQSQVVTLFHEFGHLVHWLVAHPALSSQNAFSVKGDFTEAPSQFLENWCWEYDALKLFAKNYKTGEPLPRPLFDKLKQSQTVDLASASITQVALGITDFTYEDNYDATVSKGTMQVFKEAFALTQLPFPESSHMIASFGHLSGYGANYYGYLWSKVYAQDMFSVFQQAGVMDPATGLRYRRQILEKGGTEPEIQIVEKFLGRKPNTAAFLQSLGIKTSF